MGSYPVLYYPGGPSLQPQGPYKRSKAEAADGMMAARAGDDFRKGPRSKERGDLQARGGHWTGESLPRTSPGAHRFHQGSPLQTASRQPVCDHSSQQLQEPEHTCFMLSWVPGHSSKMGDTLPTAEWRSPPVGGQPLFLSEFRSSLSSTTAPNSS